MLIRVPNAPVFKSMISNFFKLFSGRHYRVFIKRCRPVVERINRIEQEYQMLSEDGLRAKTEEFRARLQKGETLESLLPEAFAAVKNAARRLCGQKLMVCDQPLEWNMVHFDVQLIGGIALSDRKIAEMATGEGKTLVATLPLYLAALPGKGAHRLPACQDLLDHLRGVGLVFGLNAIDCQSVISREDDQLGLAETRFQRVLQQPQPHCHGFQLTEPADRLVAPVQLAQQGLLQQGVVGWCDERHGCQCMQRQTGAAVAPSGSAQEQLVDGIAGFFDARVSQCIQEGLEGQAVGLRYLDPHQDAAVVGPLVSVVEEADVPAGVQAG